MKLQHLIQQDTLVLIPGERRLDARVAVEFKEQAIELVGQGHSRVLLDLGNVDFVDSTGLAALISIVKRLGQEGRMSICCAAPGILDLFRLTRMDRVFPLYGDRDEALAAFAD